MDMMNIRKIRPGDLEKLVAAAANDGHGVWFPDFVYEKKGEIIGYFSAHVPVVLSWQHTEKVTPLDSAAAIKFIEGTLCNAPFICIPCDPNSPYMRFLPKQGYQQYTKQVNLFIKGDH